MAAVTETYSKVTEFAGDYKVVVVKVDGATGTTGTLTIDEMSNVVGCFGQLIEAPTANAAMIKVAPNATTATNVLSCVLYEDDHATACTQTAIDYMVLAIGY